MKTGIQNLILILTLFANHVIAQGTAWTYQGQLLENGSPAPNGLYYLNFVLYNNSSGSNEVAGPISANTGPQVAVTNGLFTVTLDFGSSPLTGQPLWLQIEQSTNSGASYISLSPLVQVTPTPYAIYAESAGNATGAAIGSGSGNLILLSSNSYAFIGGGLNNVVQSNASQAFIGAGQFNIVAAPFAFVGAGQSNNASGPGATVAGGIQNTASGTGATVGGGGQNTASGDYSTVAGGGGNGNSANGPYSFVGGGTFNSANSVGSYVGGGGIDGVNSITNQLQEILSFENIVNAGGGSIVGGVGNNIQAAGTDGFIGGGLDNTVSGAYGVVGGGEYNTAGSGVEATVAGGTGNTASGNDSTVSGGNSNIVTGAGSFIGGGGTDGNIYNANMNEANAATVGGGIGNGITIGGDYGFIGGGQNNNIGNSSDHSTIGGGQANFVYYACEGSTIGGGLGNHIGVNNQSGATPRGATIPGGAGNVALGDYSFAAGSNAQANDDDSFVWSDGTQITTTSQGPNTFVARATGGFYFEVAGSSQVSISAGGTLSTPVLTITGGSDVAEPFKMSGGKIPEGSVVIIDETHPGKLKLSDQPYDGRVAGVVSGANGIHPGIQMQQQGLLDGGQNVALTGRVYVKADDSNGAIHPGDLLTTSSIPGDAMKVTDHVKAQGAILGKAMTGLVRGQGTVLVLVTLQ